MNGNSASDCELASKSPLLSTPSKAAQRVAFFLEGRSCAARAGIQPTGDALNSGYPFRGNAGWKPAPQCWLPLLRLWCGRPACTKYVELRVALLRQRITKWDCPQRLAHPACSMRWQNHERSYCFSYNFDRALAMYACRLTSSPSSLAKDFLGAISR